MRRLFVLVISRKKIREAVVKHREWEASLSAWYKVAKSARWRHFAEIRQTWKSVDRIGTCVVFDIANNRCRLIAWINYELEKLFIRHILDHAEYGRGKWKNDCNP
jgi:mRNA interferase HigB